MQALLGLPQQAVEIHGFVLGFHGCRRGLFRVGIWAGVEEPVSDREWPATPATRASPTERTRPGNSGHLAAGADSAILPGALRRVTGESGPRPPRWQDGERPHQGPQSSSPARYPPHPPPFLPIGKTPRRTQKAAPATHEAEMPCRVAVELGPRGGHAVRGSQAWLEPPGLPTLRPVLRT